MEFECETAMVSEGQTTNRGGLVVGGCPLCPLRPLRSYRPSQSAKSV